MASVTLRAALTATPAGPSVQQRRGNAPECVTSIGYLGAPLFPASMSRIRHGRWAVTTSNRPTRKLLPGRVGAAAADPAVARTALADVRGPDRGRIAEKFKELKELGKVAFIPYLTAGDPDLETTVAAVKLLEKCGADIIELGVPYSDPLADGPVLQAAANRAINGGTNLDSVLKMVKEDLKDVKVPIVLFVYYNPLLRRGFEQFCYQAQSAGVSGLLVPDLPIEGTNNLRVLTNLSNIELVLLTTPTTPAPRMKAITEASQGFVYLVSLTGVTGARSSIEGRVQGLLRDLKTVTDKPVAVGFGVSTAEQARMLAEWGADGVIIGSAVVKLVGESGSPEEGLKKLELFATEIQNALPPLARAKEDYSEPSHF